MTTMIHPAHLAHIPTYLHSEVQDARKDKTGAIKVTYRSGGTARYFYKGYRIDLRTHIPPGTWGRWRCIDIGSFTTLASTVAAIDRKIAEDGQLHLPWYRAP